jgi:hypothetical protein
MQTQREIQDARHSELVLLYGSELGGLHNEPGAQRGAFLSSLYDTGLRIGADPIREAVET